MYVLMILAAIVDGKCIKVIPFRIIYNDFIDKLIIVIPLLEHKGRIDK